MGIFWCILLYCGILVSCEDIIRRLKDSVITSQSSLFLGSSDYNSAKAIDGVDRYDIDYCQCCSVTDGVVPSWWQINLGNKYLIDAVEVYSRNDSSGPEQLEHAVIYADNVSLASGNTTGVMVFTVPNIINGDSHFIKQLNSSIIAQYFNITLSRSILTLCEFKLYEKFCDVGRFGAGCSHRCHCSDQQTCNSVTGICQTPGCLDGWQGLACDKICSQHTFGAGCNTTCHCLNSSHCDPTNGTCDTSQCDPGWQGLSCSNVCSQNKFGPGCNTTCHCWNNSHCDPVNGTCDTAPCDPGWQGLSCSNVCSQNKFGPGCNTTCHCWNNSHCDPVNGTCDTAPCDPGWQGLSCSNVCSQHMFGPGCNTTCHCLNSSHCDPTNGLCDISQCDPGWQGLSCSNACDERKFDAGCNKTCHCIGGSTCSPVNGTCVKQMCELEWQGPSCSIKLFLESIDPQTPVGGIVGGVVGAVVIILIAVVIGLVLMKRRTASRKHERNSLCNIHTENVVFTPAKEVHINECLDCKDGYINECLEDDKSIQIDTAEFDYYHFDKRQTGIKIHELWDYINQHKANKFEELFGEFKKLPQGLVHEYKAAANPTNKGKNRYKGMYAYDHSRVVLDVEGGKETDYINASYIDGFDKIRMFVASQGATKDMIEDFWRMVWQLKSDKIVMLTNVIEMGTTKCLQYWPEEDECSFGNIHIKILETETFLDYNIRHIEVQKDTEMSRRIRQFHFKSWPDKDVPDSTWCLVNFWRAVETDAVTNTGPIVVHCSAGVGRTGTFIALDNMVKQAKAEGCVRPLQMVETLRRQRVNMVQTKDQYVFLHEVLADSLLFGTHFIWTKQFENMYNFMILKDKDESETRLAIQFSLILKSLQNSQTEATDGPEYSNMDALFSESGAYRPKLKKRGSRFVQELGAIYIPDYKGKNTFLLARSPDKATMDEFWSLVDDSNIKTIIMLTESPSSCYLTSCDLGASPANGNRFSVNKIDEKIKTGFTQRSYTIKESDGEDQEYLTTVKQFQYTAWKDGSDVPGDTQSFLDFIEAIQKWQPHVSDNQPILIHCGDGCSRSGIVCVILNELQRMKHEGGHINIVESVKMMKQRQSRLISSYEQYKFCYDLILAYIKNTEVYHNS